jgi:hypothetical protein
MNQALLALLQFLGSHFDLITLLFDAITEGKLTKDQATKAIKEAMIAASDAEMIREFPNGQ